MTTTMASVKNVVPVTPAIVRSLYTCPVIFVADERPIIWFYDNQPPEPNAPKLIVPPALHEFSKTGKSVRMVSDEVRRAFASTDKHPGYTFSPTQYSRAPCPPEYNEEKLCDLLEECLLVGFKAMAYPVAFSIFPLYNDITTDFVRQFEFVPDIFMWALKYNPLPKIPESVSGVSDDEDESDDDDESVADNRTVVDDEEFEVSGIVRSKLFR